MLACILQRAEVEVSYGDEASPLITRPHTTASYSHSLGHIVGTDVERIERGEDDADGEDVVVLVKVGHLRSIFCRWEEKVSFEWMGISWPGGLFSFYRLVSSSAA